MNIARLLRHLLTPRWLAMRAFRRADMDAIETAIRQSERLHRGELRFVVEGPLPLAELWRDQPVRARAMRVFAETGVWDTEANSGILLYVQLIDRRVEILADRGIARTVPQDEWEAICREMEQAFHEGDYRGGALSAIARASALLVSHFPATADNANELSDRPLRI